MGWMRALVITTMAAGALAACHVDDGGATADAGPAGPRALPESQRFVSPAQVAFGPVVMHGAQLANADEILVPFREPVRVCLARALTKNRTIAGHLDLQLAVSSAGNVVETTVLVNHGIPDAVTECVMRRLHVPAFTTNGIGTMMDLPIDFSVAPTPTPTPSAAADGAP
jgi:hypothetical protein